MSYVFLVSPKHKDLILRAIEILSSLGAPISDDVQFKYMRYPSFTLFGSCVKNYLKSNRYSIHLNSRIAYDDDFINTVIHELLHTIDNTGYSSHKGNWAKWADIVSNNTIYQIKRCGDAKLEYVEMPVIETKKCYCPLCGEGIDVATKCIKDHKSSYICKKHFKSLYDMLPDSSIKDLSLSGRTEFICKKLESGLSFEEVLDIIPYASLDDTKKLVKYSLHNFEIRIVHHKLYQYTRDKTLLKELAEEYCSGVYDHIITDLNHRFDFEGLFALTSYWIKVTNRSNEVFGKYF